MIGPYLAWNPAALFDDVWRWSNGTSETAYQIWGWGASNLVLALGWVKSRFAYWPFWLPELLVGVPLMRGAAVAPGRREHAGPRVVGLRAVPLAFFFVSRFLNENYLGYILACLTLGALAEIGQPVTSPPGAPTQTLSG